MLPLATRIGVSAQLGRQPSLSDILHIRAQADTRESTFASTERLLQTLHAKLERQEGKLADISTKLQHLDSSLDVRLACAVSSELRPLLADMADFEERLADRLDPAKRKADKSEHGQECCKPTQKSSESPGKPPSPHSAPAPPPPPDSPTGPAELRAARSSTAPPHARLAHTRTLKHSFLRRFVGLGEEEGRRDEDPPRRLRRLRARLLEGVFGICEADPKTGKEGSAAIHPQSHFVTGDPAGRPAQCALPRAARAAPPPARCAGSPPRRARFLAARVRLLLAASAPWSAQPVLASGSIAKAPREAACPCIRRQGSKGGTV
jgi:hypothetical protein